MVQVTQCLRIQVPAREKKGPLLIGKLKARGYPRPSETLAPPISVCRPGTPPHWSLIYSNGSSPSYVAVLLIRRNF